MSSPAPVLHGKSINGREQIIHHQGSKLSTWQMRMVTLPEANSKISPSKNRPPLPQFQKERIRSRTFQPPIHFQAQRVSLCQLLISGRVFSSPSEKFGEQLGILERCHPQKKKHEFSGIIFQASVDLGSHSHKKTNERPEIENGPVWNRNLI